MQNLTTGSPTRLILLFATPILLGAVFQQVYGFIDAAVVGNFLGVDSLAAVGAAGPFVFLLMGLSWGGSAGLAIPVARAFGADDMGGVRRFVAAGTFATTGTAALISVAGVLLARPVLTVMNTPAEVLDESVIFTQVLLGGAAITVTLNFLIAIVRALGDSRTPLYFLVGSAMLNAALVTLFVGGFGWSVAGAAASTVASHLITVIAMLGFMLLRMPEVRPTRQDWAAGRTCLAEPLRMAVPMGLQFSVVAIGQLVLQVAVNGQGATTVAAFTAAIRVDNIVVVPLMSFGVAIVTFVAQNRGARQWRRIRVGVYRTAALSAIIAVIAGLIFMVAARPIVGWFVGAGETEVLDMARTFFLINGGLYAIVACLFVLRAGVQGMGLSTMPTLSGIAEMVGRAFAAIVLVRHFGWVGIALAAPLAWVGGLIPLVLSWMRQRSILAIREADDALLGTGPVPVPMAALEGAQGPTHRR